MNQMTRWGFRLGGTVALLIFQSGSSWAGDSPICHYDGKERVRLISVSSNAVSAHERNHGDHGLLSWFADSDEDGYGSSASSLLACTQPAGYSTSDADCDDSNAAVYPGAAESCGNTTDDDCDGQVDEGCVVPSVTLLAHCDPGSTVLATLTGTGTFTLDAFVSANISYVVFNPGTSFAILHKCRTGAGADSISISASTNFCGLPGGCCDDPLRFNDNVCSIELF